MNLEGKMKPLTIFLSFLVISIVCGANVFASNLEWKPVDDMKTYAYRDIATDNKGTYVIVGDEGLIKTSTDLKNWTDRDSGTKEKLFGCTWGNDKFVAVGRNCILYSMNGITWSKIISERNTDITDVVWGNGKFIAIGLEYKVSSDDKYNDDNTKLILSSDDGKTWNKVYEDKSIFGWEKIRFANNLFVAANLDDMAISVDGLNWDKQKTGADDIIWDGEKYIALSTEILKDKETIKPILLTSTDATNWKPLKSNLQEGLICNNLIRYKDYYIINTDSEIYTNSDLVMNAELNNGSSVMISKDLINWKKVNSNIYPEICNLLIEKDRLIAVGIQETLIKTSDALDWDCSKKESFNFKKVIWNGTRLLAIGTNGKIYSSTDGINWSYSDMGVENIPEDIIFTGKEYYLVTRCDGAACMIDSAIYKSEDSITWTEILETKSLNIFRIFYLNNKFFGLNTFGQILVSTNGEDWSLVKTKNNEFVDLTWNGKTYVAVGMFGVIESSLDGINWTVEDSTTKADLNAIVWGNNQFVVMGSETIYLVSPDGHKWEARYTKSESAMVDIIYGGNNYVALDRGGTILTSENADSLGWNEVGMNEWINSVVWNGLNYVSVGNNGTILVSSPNNIIKVMVNDNPIVFDTLPIIKDGRTLVPLRGIIEAMGGTVDWNAETETVTMVKDNTKIEMQINNKIAIVNGQQKVLDVPAQIINDRTYVPVRFLAENFGADVEWNNENQLIKITTKNN